MTNKHNIMKKNLLNILVVLLSVFSIASCSDDSDTDYERHTVVQSFVVSANPNGSLSIASAVNTNMHLVEYALYDENYHLVCNFLNDIIEKNDALKETDGGFAVNFAETADDIPIGIYFFSVIAEDGTRYSKTIGEKYEISNDGGFYVSLSDNQVIYTINDKTDCSKIDFQVTDDGTVNKYGDHSTSIIVDDNGVIMSLTGIVASFHAKKNDKLIEVSGIVVKNVDFSNINF